MPRRSANSKPPAEAPVQGFPFDHARMVAAADLRPEHLKEFQRLCKALHAGGGFRLPVMVYGDSVYRDKIIARLQETFGSEAARLVLTADEPDHAHGLLEWLRDVEPGRWAHVMEGPGPHWFNQERWEALNIRRERFFDTSAAGMLLWLNPDQVKDMAIYARDLWSWRAGVYDFTSDHIETRGSPTDGLRFELFPFDPRTLSDKVKRISELREYLSGHRPVPDELAGPLAVELADLLVWVGELSSAKSVLEKEALPRFQRIGDQRSVAVTRGKIANVLEQQGDVGAALDIRLHQEVPVFEQLGDIRETAVARAKIADMLYQGGAVDEALHMWEDALGALERSGDIRTYAMVRGRFADLLRREGKLEQALRIWREQQLPVFEQLGDVREAAVTQQRIADVLVQRGEYDEALRMRYDGHSAFERLGDIHGVGVTRAKIADIAELRGDLQETLRIRRDEVLPIFQKLGDAREIAITYGRIADVLEAKGEFDEALRIRREEELPVLERVGDMREAAVARGAIANNLALRGESDEALRIIREEQLPVLERLRDVREAAIARERIAELLQRRGEMDDAIQTLRESVMPTFKLLGDARSLVVATTNLALALLARGRADDRREAGELLGKSLEQARALHLPELAAIERIWREAKFVH